MINLQVIKSVGILKILIRVLEPLRSPLASLNTSGGVVYRLIHLDSIMEPIHVRFEYFGVFVYRSGSYWIITNQTERIHSLVPKPIRIVCCESVREM